jgi:hypothetical protein
MNYNYEAAYSNNAEKDRGEGHQLMQEVGAGELPKQGTHGGAG